MLMFVIKFLNSLGVERTFIRMPIMLITSTKITVSVENFHATVSVIHTYDIRKYKQIWDCFQPLIFNGNS
jgi:hypothetical protein